MRVVDVTSENLKACQDFLARFEDTCQFLINNLSQHGPRLIEHHNSGNFKMLLEGEQVVGVFCLTRRGNLLAQTTIDATDIILNSCRQESVALKGFSGAWPTIAPIVAKFRAYTPDFKPTYDDQEFLYSYVLVADDPRLKHDPRVRFLEERDFEQWFVHSGLYLTELKLPNQLTFEQSRRDFAAQVQRRVWWGLFDGETLLSRVALNSNGETIGQVGGVFTPRELRQRGYAKATMFHMLKDCRDLHGHRKSLLFTGRTDIPAQKLYESMGYKRIGDYALVM